MMLRWLGLISTVFMCLRDTYGQELAVYNDLQVEKDGTSMLVKWVPSEYAVLNAVLFEVSYKEMGQDTFKVFSNMYTGLGQPVEVQVIRSQCWNEADFITSGEFRLSWQFGGLTDFDTESKSRTGWIPFDASASDLQSILEQDLEKIDVFDVVRSGPDPQGGYQWTVTFAGYPGQNLPQLAVSSSTLNAASSRITISEKRPGSPRQFLCNNNLDRSDIDPKYCTMLVTELQPYTGYMFRVRAMFDDGRYSSYSKVTDPKFLSADDGETSSPTFGSNGTRVASGKTPLDLILEQAKVKDLRHDSFLLDLSNGAEYLKGHDLLLQILVEGTWHSLLHRGNLVYEASQQLQLEEDTTYTIRSRIQSGQVATKFSSKTIKTPMEQRRQVSLNITKVSARKVELEWPVENDQVVSYQIQYRKLANGKFSTEQYDGNDRQWTSAKTLLPQAKRPVSEIQIVRTRADPSGNSIDAGWFQLGFETMGSPTVQLPYDCSAQQMKLALESLSTIRKITSVKRTGDGTHGYAWEIVFDPTTHPGDLSPLQVVKETLSIESSGKWTGPGEMVYTSTQRDGVKPVYLEEEYETLLAEIDGLAPFSWYSFRIREYFVNKNTFAEEALGWSSPTDPIRTDFVQENEQEEDLGNGIPIGAQIYDANLVMQKHWKFVLMDGQKHFAPNTQHTFYRNGIANGGTDIAPHGQPGLVVIRPSSSKSEMIASSARPKFYYFTNEASSTYTYDIPTDPLVDQLEIYAWGGGGAAGSISHNHSFGGAGAFVQATISVFNLEQDHAGNMYRQKQLLVRVGGGGSYQSSNIPGKGGANGGGNGGFGEMSSGGGGGGASSIVTPLGRLLVVAGGGGGAGSADYCCSHGGPAGAKIDHGFPGESPRDSISENGDLLSDHVDFGNAPLADFSRLPGSGIGGSTSMKEGGIAGQRGSYVSMDGIDGKVASNGGRLRGGNGGSGLQGGGGGGAGFYGGGGGGSGSFGGGGGGGSSFIDPVVLFTHPEPRPGQPFSYFAHPTPRISVLEPRRVILEWEKQPNAGYTVEVSKGGGNADFAILKFLSRTDQAIVEDNTVEPGHTYQYRLRAVSANGGYESVSDPLMVKTPSSQASHWVKLETIPNVLGLSSSSPRKWHLARHNVSELEAGLKQSEHLEWVESGPADQQLFQNGEVWTWAPPSRFGHSAVMMEGFMYVFGGFSEGASCDNGRGLGASNAKVDEPSQSARCRIGEGVTNELWRYDPATSAWEEIDGMETLAPISRAYHSAVVSSSNGKMYMFGGVGRTNHVSNKMIGGADETTVSKDSNGRILEFQVGDDTSNGMEPIDPEDVVFDDLWELDPIASEIVTLSSASSTTIDNEGMQTFVPLSLDQVLSGADDLCIVEIRKVEVTLNHPCPNEVQLWLHSPGHDGRNLEGDLGTLLLDKKSSALDRCMEYGAEPHVIILTDRASQSLVESYKFQENGEYRPSSSLKRYRGMKFEMDEWKLRVVDTDVNDSTPRVVASVLMEVELRQCEPKPVWSEVSVSSGVRPPARHSHSALIMGNELYIYGGISPVRGVLHDLWVFDFDSSTWTEIDKTNSVFNFDLSSDPVLLTPEPYGLLKLSKSMDLFQYDFLSRKWTRIPLVENDGAKPVPRYGSTVVFDDEHDRLIIFGGHNGAFTHQDIWALNLRNITAANVKRDVCSGQAKLEKCSSFTNTSCNIFQHLWQKAWCFL